MSSEFHEKSITLKGKEAQHGTTRTDAQVYNYVAKGGKEEADFLTIGEVPKYTIIAEESGIRLPKMKVESGTGKLVEVKYAVTKEGKVFIWPPYEHEDEFFVTEKDTVLSGISNEISIGTENITISTDETQGTLLDEVEPSGSDNEGTGGSEGGGTGSGSEGSGSEGEGTGSGSEGSDSGNEGTEITKTVVSIPEATKTTYEYTGNGITLEITGIDLTKMNVSGNTRTDVGTYKAQISLMDIENYEWENGTTDVIEIEWNITKKSIARPIANTTTYEYTGNKITLEIVNFNSNIMQKGGTYEATELGEYIASISLLDTTNYEWSDKTINPINISWKIQKISSVSELIADGTLKIGSSIVYTPVTTSNKYTTNPEGRADLYTGYATRTLNRTENVEWIVIKATANEVLLTSAAPLNTDVPLYLAGAPGFLNNEDILNDVCNKLYSNTTLGLEARSLTMQDLDITVSTSANYAHYAYYPAGTPTANAANITYNNIIYTGVVHAEPETAAGTYGDYRFWEYDYAEKEYEEEIVFGEDTYKYKYAKPVLENGVYYPVLVSAREDSVTDGTNTSTIRSYFKGSGFSFVNWNNVSPVNVFVFYNGNVINNTGRANENFCPSTGDNQSFSAGLRPVISLNSSIMIIEDGNGILTIKQ